ncbi:40S ribosomal protein s29-like, partial [Trifolium pratense]
GFKSFATHNSSSAARLGLSGENQINQSNKPWDTLTSGTLTPRPMVLVLALAKLVHFHGNCTLTVRGTAVLVLQVVKSTDNNNNEDLAGNCSVVYRSLLPSETPISFRVCGNSHGLIRKYGLMCCRQCFHSNAKEIGFIKYR